MLLPSVSLEFPSSSPNTVKQSTFKVDGVSAGQTVRIFSDSICQLDLGPQISNSNAVSITSNLLSFGTNTIYASVTDSAGMAVDFILMKHSLVKATTPINSVGPWTKRVHLG